MGRWFGWAGRWRWRSLRGGGVVEGEGESVDGF